MGTKYKVKITSMAFNDLREISRAFHGRTDYAKYI